jgi:hypothetical protein
VEAEKTTGGRVSPDARNLAEEFCKTESHLKVGHSQQGASSSDILPCRADGISQTTDGEKTTRGRDSPVVRNLPLPFIEATSLEESYTTSGR